MSIEFDPAKDKANLAAHGTSLALAKNLDWDAALVWIDDRFEYDELRMIALAPETAILYYVAFVERGEAQDHWHAPRHPSRGEILCRKRLSARPWSCLAKKKTK